MKRMFPVDRGLYEDKVANFWCAISPVFKLRHSFETSGILKIWYVRFYGLIAHVTSLLTRRQCRRYLAVFRWKQFASSPKSYAP